MDQVIEQIEKAKEKIKGQLEFQGKRLVQVEKSLFSSSGNIRSSLAQEVAQRQVEIDLLQNRLESLEGSLKYANEDLPRRNAERKKADELELAAQEKDLVAASLLEQLRQVEGQAQSFRNQKAEALKKSNATLKELDFRAQEELDLKQKQLQEQITMSEAHLRGAQLDLERAQKEGAPPHILAEREAYREICQLALDKLKEGSNAQ